MAEEGEGPESGPGSNGAGIDPAAMALALGGASRKTADAFLEDQRALIADQKDLVRLQARELAHELKLRHWSLQLRHASAILKFALEVSAALIALALAGIIGAAVWNAAHADGLVIESFAVPPDLAERGLTGQVVAGELLDRLSEINQSTLSARTGKSYAASWGDEIKVEIPETGVSVAEAYRFLRTWLGHESHISGAVWHSQGGIVVTARTDGKSVTVSGPEADIAGQIQKAAEAVFGLAEPYRYGVYLSSHGRYGEAVANYRQQATGGSAVDRAWGLVGLARTLGTNGDIDGRETERLYRRASLLDPTNASALYNLSTSERGSSHLEGAASDYRKFAELLGRGDFDQDGYGTISFRVLREMAANQTRLILGDYGEYIPSVANILHSGTGGSFTGLASNLARADIAAHDLKAARAASLDYDGQFQSADSIAFNKIRLGMDLADADQNWPAVVAAADFADPLLKRHVGLQDRFLTQVAPLQAYAKARLGQFKAAEALIAKTPADCDECLLQRARVAELEGQHARADWWFAHAVQDAPSIPLMYATWGQALLERGQPDAAIAQFTIANRRGPHFADPLEGWGEALMARNQSHLALAKFAEAENYAPNWGRLHLKWGEALVYVGKKDDAKAQFARAAQLDLTPSEKAELAGMAHG